MKQRPFWEVAQLLKKLPAFYRTQGCITKFTRACHWTVSWARWIRLTSSHPTSFKIDFSIVTFVIIWGSYYLTANHLWSRYQFFVCTLLGCNATAIAALTSSSVFCLSALNRLISQFIVYSLFCHNATVQSLPCPLLMSFLCLHWIGS
jgi:hypothetical protein